jgi:hypothetical protein
VISARCRPDPQRLAGRWTVADRSVHLVPAKHQLDRSADQPGRHDSQQLRTGHHGFRTEPTAQERATDMDILQWNSEQTGDALPR